jgi:hypothetical protein
MADKVIAGIAIGLAAIAAIVLMSIAPAVMPYAVVDQTNSALSANDSDDEIFDFLTNTSWEDLGCRPIAGPHLAPTCEILEFRRNGTYSWTAMSDYLERSKTGSWNFKLSNDTSNAGQMYLENGSVIWFARVNSTSVIFNYDNFTSTEKIDYSPDELKMNRSGLSEITPSKMYLTFIEKSPWRKTDDFNLFTYPELITFYSNGTFFESYRQGECSHGGTWGFDGRMLISQSHPNNCDIREGTTGHLPGTWDAPIFETSDLLILSQSSYYSSDNDTEEKVFTFDPYYRSVRVTGEFNGTFAKDVPTTIDFTFRNVDDIEKKLDKFKIEMTVLTRNNDSFSITDQSAKLVESDYSDILLQPGEEHHDTMKITPPFSGEYVYLSVNLSFRDEDQPYDGNGSFTISVE